MMTLIEQADLAIGRNCKFRIDDLKAMTSNQLWAFHLELIAALGARIAARKTRLDEWLRQLNSAAGSLVGARAYPRVIPKYRNPSNPLETWAGRGRQPRWLKAQLRSSKRLDEFRIERVQPQK